jgi:opacity protein-like surface antigen
LLTGPVFGDRVRSSGSFIGGQIGYNNQVNSTVYGIEADLHWADLRGTNTCLTGAGNFEASNCDVRHDWFGSLAARLGMAMGPSGRTLVYGKGGLAWQHTNINIVLNDAFPGGANIASHSSYSQLGFMLGAGVEYALNRNWSLKVEYDFLDFGRHNVASPNSGVFPVGPDGRNVGLSQNINALKVGINYRPGEGGFVMPPKAIASDYEIEAGVRYVYGWGQFKKDLGGLVGGPAPANNLISRLTYTDMRTNSGELYGRVDTPNNFMVKGFIGLGSGKNGHMNDEDFQIGGALLNYSNTVTQPIKDKITYGTIDLGYNWIEGPGYKATSFVGYNRFRSNMDGFGCISIAAANCPPPGVPSTGAPIITEHDTWQSLRIGTSGEVTIMPQWTLSGEVAYLPYVKFNGADHHNFGNSGVVAEIFPESGHGRGVQVETYLAYEVTKQWELGIGGRYWSMWTTKGQTDCNGGALCPVATPQQFMRFSAEQASVFLQATYKFH